MKKIIFFGFLILICFPLASDGEQMRGLKAMQLSECGQAVADFKKFLREARHCQADKDCVVMEGMCPLGCKFYVHKIFQTIVEKRKASFKGICNNVCAVKCEKENIKLECNHNKCEKVK